MEIRGEKISKSEKQRRCQTSKYQEFSPPAPEKKKNEKMGKKDIKEII